MNAKRPLAEVMIDEANAIATAAKRLDGRTADRAVRLLVECGGKVVVTGVGKSGLVAQKMAASFTSVGLLSVYLNPLDALHGDRGAVREGDIVVAEGGTWNFDESHPLAGSGLVVFRGNVVISPGSNSDFRGLLYVDGNLTLRGPAVIRGSVICTGNVTVQGAQGSNPQYAEIIYDDSALSAVRNRLGNYRIASTINRPVLGDR